MNMYMPDPVLTWSIPANIYLFKVNHRNARKMCEIWSKLTIKTPEWRHWRRSGVFNVNFKHISKLFIVFLLLILNKQMLAGMNMTDLEFRIPLTTRMIKIKTNGWQWKFRSNLFDAALNSCFTILQKAP